MLGIVLFLGVAIIGKVPPRLDDVHLIGQEQSGFPAVLAGASIKVDDLGREAAKMPNHLYFYIDHGSVP